MIAIIIDHSPLYSTFPSSPPTSSIEDLAYSPSAASNPKCNMGSPVTVIRKIGNAHDFDQ